MNILVIKVNNNLGNNIPLILHHLDKHYILNKN